MENLDTSSKKNQKFLNSLKVYMRYILEGPNKKFDFNIFLDLEENLKQDTKNKERH